jgi:hypothetical protein
MKVKYFMQGQLDSLRSNIRGNLSKYEQTEPWLGEYFGAAPFALEAEIWGAKLPDLKLPENGEKYDLENTVRLHSSLGRLNRAQASDERLWAFLAHEYYWNYMRKRWPLEGKTKKDPPAFVREHYFFMPYRSRAMVRNGIARLWWYGHVSFDPKRTDKYELTALLLSTLDITQNTLERAYGHNGNIVKGVLLAVEEWKNETGQVPTREAFRDATKYLTRIGGVTVLDFLGKEDLKQLILKRLKQNAEAA